MSGHHPVHHFQLGHFGGSIVGNPWGESSGSIEP